MTTIEETRKAFNAQGYVNLQSLLKKSDCDLLVEEIQKANLGGKLTLDHQCPKSPSVYGLPAFDSLLEQLVPHFEQATGKRLHPTYSYARVYEHGEVLRPHTDRPACEISATVTLGADDVIWPIYMADPATDECSLYAGVAEGGKEVRVSNIGAVAMRPGDAVLYRGMQKIHWRDEYKGRQQVQVFLHYVDADGPHAEWKYDKRTCLSHHPCAEPAKLQPDEVLYWQFDDVFMPEQCNAVISSAETAEGFEQAGIGAGAVDKTIRDVRRLQIPLVSPVSAMMAGLGHLANKQAWKFDVNAQNQTDYLQYGEHGHYESHTDTVFNPASPECRKLTVLMFLNEAFEGGRFYLQIGPQKIYPPQKVGSVLVFPSFMLHGVEPVTSGLRRSVVTWLSGPWFK